MNSLVFVICRVVYRDFDLSFEEFLRQLYNLPPTKSTKTNDWDILS